MKATVGLGGLDKGNMARSLAKSVQWSFLIQRPGLLESITGKRLSYTELIGHETEW